MKYVEPMIVHIFCKVVFLNVYTSLLLKDYLYSVRHFVTINVVKNERLWYVLHFCLI